MTTRFHKNVKKALITSVTSLMLAGNIVPSLAFAESIDPVDVTVEEVSQEGTDQDHTYSLTEFIQNFEELNEEERYSHIELFNLYADDERNLQSNVEEIDLALSDLDENLVSPLVDFLIQLRKDNIKELETEPSLENFDLIEENVSLEAGQTATQNEINSFSTSSSLTTSVNRLEGSNRFETAVQISRSGWSSAKTVIIVDANGFADALAGAPLAAELNAPILLAGSHSSVQATYKEVERLGATNAIVLGGENAVSKNVVNELTKRNVSVERIAGSNRYETAGLISQRLISHTNSKEAILVSGEDFADAMSVAPFAARNGIPIYLTRRTSLANEVKTASNTIKSWTIIGGGSAVSGTVGRDLQNRISSIKRIEGSNRYQTNQRVISHYGTTGNRAYIATGVSHMDALTGSVLAAKNKTAVVLTRNNDTTLQSTINYIKSRSYSRLTVFGGVAALNARVVDSLGQLSLPRTKPLIYIDPGHGGTDPGASYAGIHEKNLVLPTSFFLRDMLLSSGNYEVVMSRTSDVTRPLSDRSGEANRLNADILVSVHNNAMGGINAGQARGVETFIYHPSYTTSRSQFAVSNYRISESLRLADAVHNVVISRVNLPNRGVRGSNLHMVREPNMPAIIIELGFLDNPIDRSIITTTSFQQTSARAMKDGIDRYFGN